ncbi:MAG: periplasmic heavy metal sensor [Planctomycetes bacterium]|nr:periplasmic heavy metal sensor [Planctomycetota bacterium]
MRIPVPRAWLVPALAGALAISGIANVLLCRAMQCRPARPVQLGLSDAQLAELRARCQGCCQEQAGVDATVAALESRLERLLAEETLDRAAIESVGRELASAHARQVENCIQAVLLVRGVLSPAQLAELRAACQDGTR